ncbi:MAG: type II toxin-antitoxin system HicB family antitoxin [Gammaproteobacteria bacterium]
MKKAVVDEYLRRPYKRILIPDHETGTYTGEIAELPGCVTQGKTPTETLRRLEAAARSWIEAVLDMGQEVPEPMAGQAYSGKLMLRLSRSLHRRAAEMAHAEGVSLNQFIVITLAKRVGASEAKATTDTKIMADSELFARFVKWSQTDRYILMTRHGSQDNPAT